MIKPALLCNHQESIHKSNQTINMNICEYSALLYVSNKSILGNLNIILSRKNVETLWHLLLPFKLWSGWSSVEDNGLITHIKKEQPHYRTILTSDLKWIPHHTHSTQTTKACQEKYQSRGRQRRPYLLTLLMSCMINRCAVCRWGLPDCSWWTLAWTLSWVDCWLCLCC